jgi:Flp pilus assembly protein TadG
MLLRWAKDQDGNVAIIAGIALPALAVAAGFAVDQATLIRTHAELQNTGDAAALAAAKAMGSQDASEEAEERARAAGAEFIKAHSSDSSYTVTPSSENATVEVSVSAERPMLFGAFFGSKTRTVRVEATATYLAEMRSGCMIALDESNVVGIRLQGSAKVKAPDCGIWSNASGHSAIRMQGAPELVGREVCGAGASGNAEHRISPELTTDCGIAPDPYKGRLANMPTGCTYSDFEFPRKAKMASLSPGIYCGGLEIDSIDVTLQPGLYVITDGALSMKGNATLSGSGVTLLINGEGAALDMQGNPAIAISAMDTGGFAGIALAVTNTGDEADTSTLQGSPSLELSGSIYMPGQKLELQGSPRITMSGDSDKLIASRFDLQGSPDILIAANDTETMVADISQLRLSK